MAAEITEAVSKAFEECEKEKEEIRAYLSDVCNEVLEQQNFNSSSRILNVEKSKLLNGKMENHVHAISISISGSLVIRICIQKGKYLVEYSKYIKDHLSNSYIDESQPIKNRESFLKFSLPKDELQAIKPMISTALQYYVSGEMFGCCSRYIECSNQKQCVHPDRFYAKACQYKVNLEQGRIFYGENRNID